MTNIFTITGSCAQLAGSGLLASRRYLHYAHATYSDVQMEDGWWHRRLLLTANHWLCLSGCKDTTPTAALWSMLNQAERPPLSLPVLLASLFLAKVPDPSTHEQRALFEQVALGVADLLTLIPSVLSTVDEPASLEEIERYAATIIEGILEEASTIPWPQRETDQLRVLTVLADRLWQLPGDRVRQLVTTTLDFYDSIQQSSDDEGRGIWADDSDTFFLTPFGLLRGLSVLRWWSAPHPTIRGLPIHTPPQYLYHCWEQSLVLMHPDAPAISDDALEWLCGGTIGNPHDAPLTEFVDIDQLHTELPTSHACLVSHVKQLSEEAASGLCVPKGQWECIVDDQLPVLHALHLHSVRLVATSTGCWVRLIADPLSWGRVLWWLPEAEPPPSLAFALTTTRTSPGVLAIHTTLWEFWRDIRVVGHPSLLWNGTNI
jgi:hypothetical protein